MRNLAFPGGSPKRTEEKRGQKQQAGSPHVLIVGTPDERLRLLLALASRRKGSVGAGIPAGFAGYLMTDGYTGYQHLLSRISGIQQCCQHVIRRARQVMKLGPGGVQNWAAEVIGILGEAHRAVEDARSRGSTGLDPESLGDLLERYDTAVKSGMDPQPAPRLGLQLPRQRCRTRRDRARRRPRRHRGNPLATAAPSHKLTVIPGTP